LSRLAGSPPPGRATPYAPAHLLSEKESFQPKMFEIMRYIIKFFHGQDYLAKIGGNSPNSEIDTE